MTPLKILFCAIFIHNASSAFLNLENVFGKSLIANFEDVEDSIRIVRESEKEDAKLQSTSNPETVKVSTELSNISNTEQVSLTPNAPGQSEKTPEVQKVRRSDEKIEPGKTGEAIVSTGASVSFKEASGPLKTSEQPEASDKDVTPGEKRRREVPVSKAETEPPPVEEAHQDHIWKEVQRFRRGDSRPIATFANETSRLIKSSEQAETTDQVTEVVKKIREAPATKAVSDTPTEEAQHTDKKKEVEETRTDVKEVTTEESKDRKKREPLPNARRQDVDDDDDYDEEELDEEVYKINGKRADKKRMYGVRKWDDWGPWSHCSVSCGNGKVTRWRHCVGPGCSSGEKEAQIKTCTQPACH